MTRVGASVLKPESPSRALGRLAFVRRVIVAHRPGGADGRDGVLEDHVIGAAVLEDDGEPIEVLHPTFELGPIHEPDLQDEFLAARVIQKDVLYVRLRRRWLGLTSLWHSGVY